MIPPYAFVAGILTGHVMNESDTVMSYHLGPESETRPLANRPVLIDPTLDALKEILGDALSG